MGRTVALKVFAGWMAHEGEFRTRFLRESEAAATVGHPNILPVYEVGDTGQSLFIAMQYAPGGDAASLLRSAGPLPAARAFSIIAQIASALDAAHARGLVHGDVKPSNMLLDGSGGPGAAGAGAGQVYLSDFGIGLSRPASTSQAGDQNPESYDYTAPEQASGQPADGRADLYSLACAGYELLCGAPPFGRDQGMTARYAHMYARPPTATAKRPDLPSDVDIVLATALAKAPADRYSGCGQFAEALRAALRLGSGRPAARPARQPEQGTQLGRPFVPMLIGADRLNHTAGSNGSQPAAEPSAARPAPTQPQASAAGGPPGPYPGPDDPFPGDDERYPGPGQPHWAAGGVYIGPPGAARGPAQQYQAPADQPAQTAQWPSEQRPSEQQWPSEQQRPSEQRPEPPRQPENPFLEHAGWFREPQQAYQGQGADQGWYAGPGEQYTPGPGLPPGPRGRPGGKRFVLAATAVTVAIVVILAAVLLSRRPGGHPSGFQPSQPAPSGHSSPAPTTASGQAIAISNLLSSSANARQSLPGAVSNVRKCTNVAGAISAIQGVVNQRNNEVATASALSVSALPNGATIKSDLVAALRSSLAADQDYLSWAQQESSGCHPNAQTSAYQAAVSEDSQAATAKQTFVRAWNPDARTYGLAQESATSF